MKETLKTMKEMLISQTQPQIANLQCADYRELGEAIDMIKDLEEALYYCTVIEAMEKPEEEKYMRQPVENNSYYYTERYMPMYDDPYYRDMDRREGKMYYSGGSNGNGSSSGMSSSNGSSSSGSSNGSMNYSEYPMYMRDSREGRSPMSRRNYMESKNMHQDKSKQLKDLENYMQELTSDMTEMISGASPEEKQLLQKKLTTLSQKIEQMN